MGESSDTRRNRAFIAWSSLVLGGFCWMIMTAAGVRQPYNLLWGVGVAGLIALLFGYIALLQNPTYSVKQAWQLQLVLCLYSATLVGCAVRGIYAIFDIHWGILQGPVEVMAVAVIVLRPKP